MLLEQWWIPYITWGLIIVTILSIIIFVAILPNAKKTPTPENMGRIRAGQIRALNKSVGDLMHRRRGYAEPALGPRENYLVNYHCLGQRFAGYLGPERDGVFSEDDAVKYALMAGARLLIIEAEPMEGSVRLVTRDRAGIKRSLNEGSVARVIEAAAMAFNDSLDGKANPLANTPMILYFRFPKAVKLTEAHANQIADALYPIKNMCLSGLSPQGDFSHRRGQGLLALMKPTDLTRRFIIITNYNTQPFDTSGKAASTMRPDFDYYINARVMKYNEVSTEITVQNYIKEVDYSFLEVLDENGTAEMIKKARVEFMICVGNPTELGLKKAREIGIQGVTGFVFDGAAGRVLNMFKGAGYVPKGDGLRYVSPEAMQIAAAPKEMNAGGGVLRAPKV